MKYLATLTESLDHLIVSLLRAIDLPKKAIF
jgi:hypothetical protein